ncbi:MAG: hybrid sensor histidine kinase/response regulator [Proteobacteria bacterium]|nr:hybrid sensor histidine kinase/response regulator [Pseudomonadota bacterium]
MAKGRIAACDLQTCSRYWLWCLPLLAAFWLLPAEGASRLVRLGVYDNPPKVFRDSRARPAGFFIELADEVGRQENWKIEYVDCAWVECLQKLESGEIDLMPDVAVSQERAKNFDFHNIPVAHSWSTILYHPRLPVLGLKDLAGRRIAILRGAIQEVALSKMMAGSDIAYQPVYVDSLAQGFDAVKKGDADAVVGNNFYSSRNAADYGLRQSPIVFSPASLQFATAKGRNQDLLTAIDYHLALWRHEPDSVFFRALARATAAPPVEIVGISGRTLLAWGGPLLLLLVGGVILIIFSNRRLERLVALRTAELQQEVETRRQAEAQLQSHRDNLERLVNERTVELQMARQVAEAANLAKSDFLASMSHELRTPLNAILGFSQLMSKDASASPAQREQLGIINRSGEHLLAMINDVLDLSKIETGKMTLVNVVFNLPHLCSEVAGLMRLRASEKGLWLRLLIDEKVPVIVRADVTKLRQIMINLLGNAVKFTLSGGVTLQLSSPEPGRLRIEVCDTGPGIEENMQQAIFDPFVQAEHKANAKGTGLGLAITRKIVEKMDGCIGLTSALGKGSCFWLEMPLEAAAEIEGSGSASEVREAVGLLPGQPVWRILVAEDDHDSQVFIQELLRQIGFEVRIVGNGQDAVHLFREWQPHLVLMDIRMPLLDGMQATRILRGLPEGRTVPVIALTASVFAEEQPQILAAGCDEVVFKPINIARLLNRIAHFLPVRYRYDEPEVLAVGESDSPDTAALAEIAVLPAELRQSLFEAARRLDAETIEEALPAVTKMAPALAGHIERLLRRYDFGRIAEELAADAG